MPIQLVSREKGLQHGLSVWLDRLARFVNGEEADRKALVERVAKLEAAERLDAAVIAELRAEIEPIRQRAIRGEGLASLVGGVPSLLRVPVLRGFFLEASGVTEADRATADPLRIPQWPRTYHRLYEIPWLRISENPVSIERVVIGDIPPGTIPETTAFDVELTSIAGVVTSSDRVSYADRPMNTNSDRGTISYEYLRHVPGLPPEPAVVSGVFNVQRGGAGNIVQFAADGLQEGGVPTSILVERGTFQPHFITIFMSDPTNVLL